QHRQFLAAAVARDAAAFEKVMAAYRMPKAERAPFVEAALHEAAAVPMEVAEHAYALRAQLSDLALEAPARFSSDLETARALAGAALTGALANVRINLESIHDEEFRTALAARAGAVTT
ncbi:MAG TPA: cyclodeaminase/cyclohydrolase family protein, partial [Bryobacteraceae bacterium]|nr:cyclodeaminase/cyclohydrolase family protein [Bryobacteraceae bacterium]